MCGLAEALLCRDSRHAIDHWGPWGNHNAKPLYNRSNRSNYSNRTRCAGGKAAVASRNREHDSRMDIRPAALQTNSGRIFVSGPFRFSDGVPVGGAGCGQITATIDAAARASGPAGQDRLSVTCEELTECGCGPAICGLSPTFHHAEPDRWRSADVLLRRLGLWLSRCTIPKRL